MSHISEFQLSQMQARLAQNKARHNGEPEPQAQPAEREGGLHTEIILECNRRGWLVIHSRMNAPSTVGIGTPDFVILCDGGRTLLVEAKALNRKPTQAQLAWLAWAKRLGHRCAVVRSFAEFLQVAEAP